MNHPSEVLDNNAVPHNGKPELAYALREAAVGGFDIQRNEI